MKNQKGFTVAEVVCLLLIICVLGLIGSSSYRRARVSAVTEPFRKHFGVSLEDAIKGKVFLTNSTEWLAPEQKVRLCPIVGDRLQTLCTGAAQLEGPSECRDAIDAARRLGL